MSVSILSFHAFLSVLQCILNISNFHLRRLPHPIHHDAAAGRFAPLLHGTDIGAVPSAGPNLRLEDQPHFQRSSLKHFPPCDDYE